MDEAPDYGWRAKRRAACQNLWGAVSYLHHRLDPLAAPRDGDTLMVTVGCPESAGFPMPQTPGGLRLRPAKIFPAPSGPWPGSAPTGLNYRKDSNLRASGRNRCDTGSRARLVPNIR